MKKTTVLNIVRELYLIKNKSNRNLIFISNRNNYKKIIKNDFKLKSILYVVVDFRKFKLSEVLKVFFSINKYHGIRKNFMIFFDLEKELIAHNFFPDWPNKYNFSNNFESFFLWFKKILFNLFFFKKIKFIVFKFKWLH